MPLSPSMALPLQPNCQKIDKILYLLKITGLLVAGTLGTQMLDVTKDVTRDDSRSNSTSVSAAPIPNSPKKEQQDEIEDITPK
ncbi:hypothetical protein L2E82_35587 [Cichorium intybus]|uniref:Uncharacterized protein n=1 Tax=Cichorium intybus TaxID=13427 RepID=A0ACB9BP92_CICIN|nr:hypothetical protein L2E82_35587 [Cichorium intybus]